MTDEQKIKEFAELTGLDTPTARRLFEMSQRFKRQADELGLESKERKRQGDDRNLLSRLRQMAQGDAQQQAPLVDGPAFKKSLFGNLRSVAASDAPRPAPGGSGFKTTLFDSLRSIESKELVSQNDLDARVEEIARKCQSPTTKSDELVKNWKQMSDAEKKRTVLELAFPE